MKNKSSIFEELRNKETDEGVGWLNVIFVIIIWSGVVWFLLNHFSEITL